MSQFMASSTPHFTGPVVCLKSWVAVCHTLQGLWYVSMHGQQYATFYRASGMSQFMVSSMPHFTGPVVCLNLWLAEYYTLQGQWYVSHFTGPMVCLNSWVAVCHTLQGQWYVSIHGQQHATFYTANGRSQFMASSMLHFTGLIVCLNS